MVDQSRQEVAERLWTELVVDEPEPEKEITSGDINRQTMKRMQEKYS